MNKENATSIWSCKSKLFADAMDKLGLSDAMKKVIKRDCKRVDIDMKKILGILVLGLLC